MHRGQHRLVPTFYIARYPVTNAQFAAFVEDGGYGRRRYWPEAEKAGYWREGRFRGKNQPEDYGTTFNLPNHPVVGVSWYEALAYCRWLDEKLQDLSGLEDLTGLHVMLPSEAEWEKAARGGLQIPASVGGDRRVAPVGTHAGAGAHTGTPLRNNPNPGRRYPWGNEPDPNRANYDETDIRTTSAVGCFPGGASPYGVEDLSGNVWEWTRSLFREYPYDPDDGREKLDNNGRRVLRGGSFGNDLGLIRCAARGWHDPDLLWYNGGLRVGMFPVSL